MRQFESVKESKFQELSSDEMQMLKGGGWEFSHVELECESGDRTSAVWKKQRSNGRWEFKRKMD